MATVQADLGLAYRLGTVDDLNWRFAWVLPTTDTDEPRVVSKWPPTAQPISEHIGALIGAWVTPTILTPATVNTGLEISPHGHVYYRIWVVPSLISLENPALLTNIPFILWNAYLVSNSLTSITPTGATGLTLSISAPLVFDPVEEQTVNLQVTDAAPAVVDASYLFTFTYGTGILDFEAVLIEWIKEIAEIPVTERWSYLTDVIRSWNGTEQRISVRRQPRRFLEFPILLDDDADRRDWYDRLYSYTGSQVLIPFFQYHTYITTASAIGTTQIFFDPAKTDVRASEYVVILRESTEESFVLKLTTLLVNGANLNAALTRATQVGDMIIPAAFGRLVNKTSISMGSVAGSVDLGAYIIDFRSQFNRPGSVASITTYDSLQVLTELPVVTRSKADEQVDVGPLLIDNESGVYEQRVPWSHAFIEGGRQYYIPRRVSPVKMDYWRDFLTATVGGRVSFLMPSWRDDLVLSVIPSAGATQILFSGAGYANKYFAHDTYQRFQFTNPTGDIIYRKASAAIAQPGNTSLVTLDTPLPTDVTWSAGFVIAYLNRVRIFDEVELTHFGTYSLLGFTFRTCDQ